MIIPVAEASIFSTSCTPGTMLNAVYTLPQTLLMANTHVSSPILQKKKLEFSESLA